MPIARYHGANVSYACLPIVEQIFIDCYEMRMSCLWQCLPNDALHTIKCVCPHEANHYVRQSVWFVQWCESSSNFLSDHFRCLMIFTNLHFSFTVERCCMMVTNCSSFWCIVSVFVLRLKMFVILQCCQVFKTLPICVLHVVKASKTLSLIISTIKLVSFIYIYIAVTS